MSKVFEAIATQRVIVLPDNVPPSARCLVAVMEDEEETLESQAKLTLPKGKQQRMSELLLKNRDGQLSDEEKKELDALSAEFDAATLIKGRALSILAQLEPGQAAD